MGRDEFLENWVSGKGVLWGVKASRTRFDVCLSGSAVWEWRIDPAVVFGLGMRYLGFLCWRCWEGAEGNGNGRDIWREFCSDIYLSLYGVILIRRITA